MIHSNAQFLPIAGRDRVRLGGPFVGQGLVRHELQHACKVMDDLISSSGTEELSGPPFSYPRAK